MKNKATKLRRVSRNVLLATTRNDNSARLGTRLVPNKKKQVRKFDFRKYAD